MIHQVQSGAAVKKVSDTGILRAGAALSPDRVHPPFPQAHHTQQATLPPLSSISPSVVVVAVGQTATPRASWCRGGHYDRVSPQWSLGQAAYANVISVDATTGEITGRRAGRASVISTYEGAEGSRVEVTVQ